MNKSLHHNIILKKVGGGLAAFVCTASLLAGCGSADKAADTAESTDVATDSVTDSAGAEESAAGAGTDSSSTAADTTDTAAAPADTNALRDLTASELGAIEKDFNTPRYNGFLSTEFETPKDIWWDEVFYTGAGISRDLYGYETIQDAYIKETGEGELFGDLTYVEAGQLEDFVTATTGLSYSEMNHPLEWLRLKDPDVYVIEHGDTNYSPVKFISGTVEGDRFKCIYIHEFSGPEDNHFEVVFDKKDDEYVFVSNLWAPEEGREAGIEAIYDTLIKKYAVAVANKWDEDQLNDVNVSTFCTREYGASNPSDVIGYYRADLDGDGTDELLFGAIKDTPDPVYDAYSIKDGMWLRLFMSYDDDNLYYAGEDSTFYHVENYDSDIYLSHEYMKGAYKFLTPMDSARKWEGAYEYSTDSFWKDIQNFTEAEFNDYKNKCEASYIKIPYTPLSTVDIGTGTSDDAGETGASAKSGESSGDSDKAADTSGSGTPSGSYSDDELCQMALDYYEKEYDYRPGIADIDSSSGNVVTIHLYDDMGDHTATSAWYEIDRTTGKGEDIIFGEKVDLGKTK